MGRPLLIGALLGDGQGRDGEGTQPHPGSALRNLCQLADVEDQRCCHRCVAEHVPGLPSINSPRCGVRR